MCTRVCLWFLNHNSFPKAEPIHSLSLATKGRHRLSQALMALCLGADNKEILRSIDGQ